MDTTEIIKEALQVLKDGGIILYPTDTVWGLGCDATNEKAVTKIYEIKFDDDIPVSVAIDQAVELSKRFGRDESYSFINGILAKLAN